jgi:acetyl esterase/lipase
MIDHPTRPQPVHTSTKKLLGFTIYFACMATAALAQPTNALPFTRVEDVIYGRKSGTALTLDVFRPAKANGFGIVMMVSGGWFSSHEGINPAMFQPLLNRGYSVFAVVHGSQPKFTVTEIVPDIHRAIRFIRHHAVEYGIDPNHLGITGGSAGGHLSLTMAVQGTPGDPNAKDVIDRGSSAVQCVACFFPPTDFLNYGQPGEDAVGVGTLKNYKAAFGPRSDTAEERQKLGREISPIYFVRSNQPPVLIIHGDADKLVPIYQAEKFVERSRAAGATARLIVRAGKDHGWPELIKDEEIFADWFDEHLRGLKPAAPGK